MYVGRFIVVAPDRAAYRVSSRSFPNRKVIERDGALTVVPTATAPETDNPYISYNCLRTTDDGESAVIGNGTHVDPIAEKLELGYPPRDALAESLLALDYEKDDYDTPRIAGVVGDESYIATVRRDALLVEAVAEPTLVATYEADAPEPTELAADEPAAMAADLYDRPFEHPVCAAAVARSAEGFRTALHNGE
ncbi:IMP cyclohydrolase [Natronomonas sp.]|uniref:IMP cyclohydrolase n=1 Tax=Natronomonas sp. TaxID=2184060 RepID=UPI0026039441|nr:IMP cyclohydrolase [Natronomonas sp.]